jgi:DNA polymerase-3 subunit delta
MAKKSAAITALEFLSSSDSHAPKPVNVLFGDEAYLKREALATLTANALSGADAEFSVTKYAGPATEWRDVSDELCTVSLFGSDQRLVVIEEADDFVSQYRGELEDYVARPSSVGTLVLVATSWPKNTRLYKALIGVGLQIDCGRPAEKEIGGWLRARAEAHYGIALSADAAKQLVEIVGLELGLLNQELDKLSLMAGDNNRVTPQLVREMVGGWRAKTAWDMLDAAYEGNTAEALGQLERLIHAGEHPIAILAQISSSLRRFAAAARIVADHEARGQRVNLRGALEQAGVNPYFLAKSEKQLRSIGRNRALQLYQWLIEADLALKGPSSAPNHARLVLEKLLVRIASPIETPPRTAAALSAASKVG